MKKRNRAALAVFAVAAAAFLAFTASALAGPHFMSANSSVASNGALVVSFDETGLGNGNID